MRAGRDVLPVSCPPRCLSRPEAAAYVGVSPTKFDELVSDGRMPKGFRIDARRLWDRLKLDAAVTDLSDTGDRNPLDEVLGL